MATYNIRKARGLDGRVRLERIAAVIGEIDADVVGLQEVFAGQKTGLQKALGGYWAFAAACDLDGEPYGNATYSRWPIAYEIAIPLTVAGREPRVALRTDVRIGGEKLYFFNLHLGMSRAERGQQADRLRSPDYLTAADRAGRRVVVGDLNETTRGAVTRVLRETFASPRPHAVYPPLCPILPLDQIHADASLAFARPRLHRSRLALIASDHAPLVADSGKLGRRAREERGHEIPKC